MSMLKLIFFFSGYLSEQGSEHYNKFLKHDREHHSPQTNAEQNIKAMFLRPTYMSDPVINKHIEKEVRKENKSKQHKPIPDGAKALLKKYCPCQNPPPAPVEVVADIEEPLVDLVNPPVGELEDENEAIQFIVD